MFQCVGERVSVLWPGGGRAGPEEIDVAGVHVRYGIEPAQVPDFIALRGDPSDGLPGAKGIGEKTARDLLREHGTLEDLIAAADRPSAGLRPRVAETLHAQAAELRAFREIATLRPVEVERPPDAPLRRQDAADAARARGMNRLAARLDAWTATPTA
jgi:DNA polymerase-1